MQHQVERDLLKKGSMRRCKEPEITSLRKEEIPLYLETGSAAYEDHYCHLWPGGDPWPYLTRNFTPEILHAEMQKPNLRLWLVYCSGIPAGICKLDLDKGYGSLPAGGSLFIEKIYLKKSFTGQGLGSSLIRKITRLGQEMGRQYLWLEAMQKGPALSFYLNHGFKILGETQVPHPEALEAEKKMWVLGREI
ncbi:MAG: GNAT family N-acetyltransferase [Robiginitalea sp.]|jgi:GNAT superfamily N-acetyltransferase